MSWNWWYGSRCGNSIVNCHPVGLVASGVCSGRHPVRDQLAGFSHRPDAGGHQLAPVRLRSEDLVMVKSVAHVDLRNGDFYVHSWDYSTGRYPLLAQGVWYAKVPEGFPAELGAAVRIALAHSRSGVDFTLEWRGGEQQKKKGPSEDVRRCPGTAASDRAFLS